MFIKIFYVRSTCDQPTEDSLSYYLYKERETIPLHYDSFHVPESLRPLTIATLDYLPEKSFVFPTRSHLLILERELPRDFLENYAQSKLFFHALNALVLRLASFGYSHYCAGKRVQNKHLPVMSYTLDMTKGGNVRCRVLHGNDLSNYESFILTTKSQKHSDAIKPTLETLAPKALETVNFSDELANLIWHSCAHRPRLNGFSIFECYQALLKMWPLHKLPTIRKNRQSSIDSKVILA